MTQQERISIKIVVIGEAGTGKSSFINRYVTDKFELSVPTIGLNIAYKKLKILGKNVKLDIWDTAGQERFHSTTRSIFKVSYLYIKGSDALILVYDVTQRQSFNSIIDYWLAEANENTGDVPKLLIGAKSDQVNREVPSDEGKKFADMKNLLFYEISSKLGTSVDEAVTKLVTKVVSDFLNKKANQNVQSKPIIIQKQAQSRRCSC